MSKKLTISINNVYGISSDDMELFNVMVTDHNQSIKFDVANIRTKRAKLGRYLDKFYKDAKEAGYNKPNTAKLVSKYFDGFLTEKGKINSVLISNYRKFGNAELKTTEYAVKIGSQSANPIRLNGLYATFCKDELAKVKQQERLDDTASDDTASDDTASDDATETEVVSSDGNVKRRVQGSKHLQREVEPERKGESKPVTPAESVVTFTRSATMVISFDNDDSYTKEQKAEVIRVSENLIKHLLMESDDITVSTSDDTVSELPKVVTNLFDNINNNMVNAVG